MNENFSCEVTGLDKLQAALEDLGDKQAKAIVRDATRAAGKDCVQALVESSGGVHGEPGDLLRDPKSWKMRYRSIKGELAGSVKIFATGSLPKERVGTGKGKQPKGRLYHRSLAYLVKLMELGPTGQRYPVMTSAFDSHASNFIDKIVQVIQQKLARYGK